MTFGALAFTPLVKKLQERYGSRRQYERMEKAGEPQDSLTEFEESFLADRDTFYMSTTGATGWPYIQHRGGPKGFLKVIDNRTLAFADFRGNKQYISTGNLLSDDRVALIFIDYPRQARLKILGRAKIFEGHEADGWLPRVLVPGYNAVTERVYVIHIEAYDWNCPQHIVPRYTAEEIRDGMQEVEKRMQALEHENETLRKELATARTRSNTAL
jgi:uncharacterized protein